MMIGCVREQEVLGPNALVDKVKRLYTEGIYVGSISTASLLREKTCYSPWSNMHVKDVLNKQKIQLNLRQVHKRVYQ